MPKDFKPDGFEWVTDTFIPTNRTDALPYKENRNFTAVIDGFLISPNIDLININTHPLDFKFTDHNPVTGTFKLK